MSLEWNYNMSISEVIDVLENTSFSRLQYKDLILSYHIQRLNEKNNRQSTTQTQDQNQQQLVTPLSQKIAEAIKTHEQIFDNQFSYTQAMFDQIQEQNIPQLNDSMNKVTTQLQNLAQSKTVSQSFSLFEKSEKFQKQESTISGISDVQSELRELEIFIDQYIKKFNELTEKLKIHKQKFLDEKKKIQAKNKYQ